MGSAQQTAPVPQAKVSTNERGEAMSLIAASGILSRGIRANHCILVGGMYGPKCGTLDCDLLLIDCEKWSVNQERPLT